MECNLDLKSNYLEVAQVDSMDQQLEANLRKILQRVILSSFEVDQILVTFPVELEHLQVVALAFTGYEHSIVRFSHNFTRIVKRQLLSKHCIIVVVFWLYQKLIYTYSKLEGRSRKRLRHQLMLQLQKSLFHRIYCPTLGRLKTVGFHKYLAQNFKQQF